MKLTVIVPVHNGGEALFRCLSALAGSARRPDEVIVVDDGSTDGSATMADRLGATVLTLTGGPFGPATARNRGADRAAGDALVFIDADVAVHRGTLGRIEHYLSHHPEVDALFGSYDDTPPDPGLASVYKNLLHHDTHQRSRLDASTFWAGCGAIRSDAFRACGGFDQHYTRPSIEDIELGVRLRRLGYRVWSCPDVQATHLKRWTLGGLLRTDIFTRAVPWSRLIIRTGSLPNDLNVGTVGRISAAAAWVTTAASLAAVREPWAWLALIPAFCLFWACNLGFLSLVRRRKGMLFCLGAASLHLLYYLYSSSTFAVVAVHEVVSGRGRLTGPAQTRV